MKDRKSTFAQLHLTPRIEMDPDGVLARIGTAPDEMEIVDRSIANSTALCVIAQLLRLWIEAWLTQQAETEEILRAILSTKEKRTTREAGAQEKEPTHVA